MIYTIRAISFLLCLTSASISAQTIPEVVDPKLDAFEPIRTAIIAEDWNSALEYSSKLISDIEDKRVQRILHYWKGKSLIKLDRANDGVGHMRNALGMVMSAETADPREICFYLNELALVFIVGGDLNSAMRYNTQAKGINNGEDKVIESATLRNLGLIRMKQRAYRSAYAYLITAQDLATQNGDNLTLAKLQTDLGSLNYKLMNIPEATNLLRKSSTNFKSIPGNVWNRAIALQERAKIHLLNNEIGKSLFAFEEVIEILEDKFGANHPSLVAPLSGFGRALIASGELSEAEENLNRALAISENIETSSAIKQARANYNLAVLKLHRKETEAVLEHCNSAKLKLQNVDNPDVYLLSQINRLEAHAHLQNYWISNEFSQLEKAKNKVDLSISALDNLLTLMVADYDKLSLLKERDKLFDLGLIIQTERLLVASDREEIISETIQLIDRNKAQILKSHHTAIETAKWGNNTKKEYSRLVKSLNEKYQAIFLAKNSATALSVHEKEIIILEEELRKLVNVSAASEDQRFNSEYADMKFDVSTLQNSLKKHQAALSYYLQDSVYHIFYIDHDRTEWFSFENDFHFTLAEPEMRKKKIKIFNKDIMVDQPQVDADPGPTNITNLTMLPDLDSAIDAYLRSIKKFDKLQFASSAKILHDKLIAPISYLLENKTQIVIIPHARLHEIPFEALLTEAPKESKQLKYGKMPFLINDYGISYQSSLNQYEEKLQKNHSQEPTSFLAFAPVFNDTLKGGWIWNSRDYLRDTSYFRKYSNLDEIHRGGGKYRELKFSKEEVVNAAKLFAKKDIESEVYLFGEATESNFKSNSPGARIIHIASHSFIDFAEPGESGIAFFKSEDEGAEDGVLTMAETFNLDLEADLVVMSSCESGVGKYGSGEGVLSLSRGFLFSGAQNAMVSLWKVSDRSTSKLMHEFYSAFLNENYTYQEALRKAKLKLLESERTAAPRFWSAFVLIGR